MKCICQTTNNHYDWIFVCSTTKIRHFMRSCKECFQYEHTQRLATKEELNREVR